MTREGKRHVVTVPVKLARLTNDLHKQHPDSEFCYTTIRYLEELASILGSKEVLFLSQDDKVGDNVSRRYIITCYFQCLIPKFCFGIRLVYLLEKR